MSIEVKGSRTCRRPRRRVGTVTLSQWVNERCPEWAALLSAHEVARLTRRPHCMLSTLAFLGRFPKQQRYRGRRIGWRRVDVEHWLNAQSRHRMNRVTRAAPMEKHRVVCWKAIGRMRRRRCARQTSSIGPPQLELLKP